MSSSITPDESFYQNYLIDYFHAVKSFHLPSGKIVDLMNKDLAIEVEFMHKWAESIGQSLQYSYESGKRPCIVFIYNYSKHVSLLTSILPTLKRLCIRVYTIGIYDRRLILILD